MNKEILEMCYEFVDVESYEYIGYRNCIDIHVDNDDSTFLLANGVVSHNSALGGLMPSLGREDTSYYALKGKPLNAYTSNQKKFTENKELSGLYQIIKNGIEVQDIPDGDFYEIEIEGNKLLVNINDEVKVGSKWYKVKDIINECL